MPVLRVIALDEVLQVGIAQGIGLQGEVLVGAEIINPELLRPGLFAGRAAASLAMVILCFEFRAC